MATQAQTSLINTKDLKQADVVGNTYNGLKAPTTGPNTFNSTADVAKLGTLTPANTYNAMLVSDQMAKLTQQGSPVFDSTRASAYGAANSRGLLNSSMGVQAGEKAVIDASYTMANADAGFVNDSRKFNAGAKNDFALTKFKETNNLNLGNANNKTNVNTFNAGAKNDASRDLFNTTAQIGITNANNQLSADMADTAATNAANANFASTVNNATAANVAATNTANQFNAGALNDEAINNANIAANQALQVMDDQQQQWTAKFNAEHDTLIKTSDMANSAYTETMNYIAAIQTDTKLNAATKKAMIDQQLNALNDQFNILETVNGVVLGDIKIDTKAASGSTTTTPPPTTQGPPMGEA